MDYKKNFAVIFWKRGWNSKICILGRLMGGFFTNRCQLRFLLSVAI